MAKLKSKSNKFFGSKHSKKNIVFLPYKASMWDSLESIWKTAYEDKSYCNTYVVPIPYADIDANGKVAKWHCEIDLFPKNVPVLDYKKVNLKKLKPDVIFIHNPYDNYNRVTSVDSNYYSFNLKKLTDFLIYVPYYVTGGKMSEGQSYMPSYDNMDYIIIQSGAMRPFFDPSIPEEKLQPLGSPKFDRVIQMCQNPPKVPEKWKDKMNGRRVFFYNTSLGGLLHDTRRFLLKMRYVFETFSGREDACLLWRPHPLINATLSSMRPEFQEVYEQLKNYFMEKNLGIYDDTADIDKSIALSDVYIGDAKTSVTSLFGVAGKPIFVLNNNINVLPKENDWRGTIIKNFHPEGKDWMITQGRRLYHAPNHDFHYKYYCDLSEHAAGNYYRHVLEINGKVYVCPFMAQDILIVNDHKIERKIQLKKVNNVQKDNMFSEVVHLGDYIFLLPNKYPELVCYNVKNDTVQYLSGFGDFFVQTEGFDFWRNAHVVWNDNLFVASPNRRSILIINTKTFEMQQMNIPSRQFSKGGFFAMVPDGDTFWLLPNEDTIVVKLDMRDGTVVEYSGLPKDFQFRRSPQGAFYSKHAFTSAVCDENELFLSPYGGNMFVRLDKKTGRMQEWKTPFNTSSEGENSYFYHIRIGQFNYSYDKKEVFFIDFSDRQWYNFDLQSKSFTKIDMTFDLEELKQHTSGFVIQQEWNPYACYEGVFQTLKDLLDNTLPGKPFDRETQLKAYEKFNASMEGKAGEKIYQFTKQKLEEKEKN